jgi:hypothetical protein
VLYYDIFVVLVMSNQMNKVNIKGVREYFVSFQDIPKLLLYRLHFFIMFLVLIIQLSLVKLAYI